MPRILQALQRKIGKDNVTTNEAVLASYAFGGGETHPREETGLMPEYVATPETSEQVQAIIKIANRYRIPVTPVASGLGSHYATEGGILVDTYARMKKIHEINAEDGYAVIEPGVPFGALARKLKKHNCHFPFGSFPSTVSVLGHILRNPGTWTMFGQAGGKELISLEIVLGNGDIVRTGFAALPEPDWSVPSPHAVYPDLTNIFVHSLGTLGIVTKASVRIYSRNEKRAMPVGTFDALKDAYETVKKLERAYLIESGPIYHWRDVEFFGLHVNNPMEKIDEKLDQLLELTDAPPFEKNGETPYCFAPFIMSGYKGEIENRVKFISKFVNTHHGRLLSEHELRGYLGDGYFDLWQLGFMDHTPMDQIARMKAQRFQVNSTTFVGPPRKCVEAEPEILRKAWDFKQEFRKKGVKLRSTGYYFHPADQARTCYFRTGFVSTGSREELVKILHELNDLAIKKYGLHPAPATWHNYYVDKVLASYYNLYKHLKKYSDPNSIMNPGMDMLSKPSEVVKF